MRPAPLLQAAVGRGSASTGRHVAAERSAATLSPRVARRSAASAASVEEVAVEGESAEAAVLELVLQRRFEAAASECRASVAGARRGLARGVVRAAFDAVSFPLLQVFLVAAAAGRQTASSRDAG